MKGMSEITEIQKLTLGFFIAAIFLVWFGFAFTHDLLPQIENPVAAISQGIRQ
jgi:hypothetical protein